MMGYLPSPPPVPAPFPRFYSTQLAQQPPAIPSLPPLLPTLPMSAPSFLSSDPSTWGGALDSTLHRNSGLLLGLGAGLLSGNPSTIGQDMLQGAQSDREYALQKRTLDAQNSTIQWLQQNGYNDLVPIAQSGDIAGAYSQAMARQNGGKVADYLTSMGADPQLAAMARAGQISAPDAVGMAKPIPMSWGSQGYIEPLTMKQVPIDGAGMNSGTPLGTTGSSMIDPTVDGYSSKTVAGSGGLTQAAIDQRALNAIISGSPPPTGRNGLAGAQNAAISNRMAEIDPTGNLAANRTQLKSLSSSLTKQQTYLDQTERSISNAENGFQQIVNTFQGKVNPSNFPSVNAALNAIAGQTDPGTISAFRSGLQEVANEYTQVFSRGGQVTDSVRNRANDILNGNLSIPQLQQVLNELQAQGAIVIQGAKDQIGQINGQISALGQGRSTSPSTYAAPTTGASGMPSGTTSSGLKWSVVSP